MKANIICILLFIFSISCFGQEEIRFKHSPPGTIKLNDSLYIDVAPVDNFMYVEFVKSLKNFWSLDIHKELIELNKFGLDIESVEEKFNSKLTGFNIVELIIEDSSIASLTNNNRYFNHPKYSKYPMVNVSKNYAELFCKWRTDMVMLNWAINSKTEVERTEYPSKVEYKLPKTSEFEEAINLFGYSKNKKNVDKSTPIKPYGIKYKKNYKKAIFLKNNISEYTLDSIPYGSNWKSSTDFKELNNYTGFRCVCEIKQ